MKAVKVALCGVECVNLLTNAMRILGIFYSYNFLGHITKLQKIINIFNYK